MSKKDDTIKALKKKLKKLKAQLDALKGPAKKKDERAKAAGKKSAEKKASQKQGATKKEAKAAAAGEPAKNKPKKSKPEKIKSTKTPDAAAKAQGPLSRPDPMKIVSNKTVANEPTPLPPSARIATG